MNDRRDDFDDWLRLPIEPLYPPPGTYERIVRNVRRRRRMRAGATVAGAALAVGLLSAAPRLLLGPEETATSAVVTATRTAPATGWAHQPGALGSSTSRPGSRHGRPGPWPVVTPHRCRTALLSVRIHPGAAGTAAGEAALVLTNRSASTCGVYGYVGMQLLDARGEPVHTAVVRDRAQAPRLVVLAPGRSAWTRLRWSAPPRPGRPAALRCASVPAYVEVTPPDESAHLVTRWAGGSVCDRGRIVIEPLAPGRGP